MKATIHTKRTVKEIDLHPSAFMLDGNAFLVLANHKDGFRVVLEYDKDNLSNKFFLEFLSKEIQVVAKEFCDQ
jgi:hypothetical protein